jgi:hypothetical protein
MNPNPLHDVVEDAQLTLPPGLYLFTASMKLVKVEFPSNILLHPKFSTTANSKSADLGTMSLVPYQITFNDSTVTIPTPPLLIKALEIVISHRLSMFLDITSKFQPLTSDTTTTSDCRQQLRQLQVTEHPILTIKQ